jgi:GNAT superfamily N-acetyltransferase
MNAEVPGRLDRLLGQEAIAISQDAPKFFGWTEPGGWMVATGANETVFNIGMVFAPDQNMFDDFFAVLNASSFPFEIWIPQRNLDAMQSGIAKHSLTEIYRLDHMILSPESLARIQPPPNSKIELVDSTEKLQQVIGIHMAVFGFDASIVDTMGPQLLTDQNIKTWLVYQDGLPVSTAMAIIDPKTQTAGVWNVATLEDYQHQGLGTAIMSQLLVILRETGINVVHLASTTKGHKLYENIGFVSQEPIICFGVE